jgi:multiple sugar transport system substrate-binding protein
MKSGLNELRLSRRSMLLGGTAALGALALGTIQARAQTGPVRFGIFGNAEKLEIRGRSVARYAELHPDVQVVYEGVPSDAWPDKIAAMVAGGNAPDVITLGTGDLEQYATRGALQPLDELIPDPIRGDLFETSVLDLGRVGGTLYGLPIAVSIQGMGYNQSALERMGLDAPPENWTYDDYAAYCAEVHKADASVFGCHDGGARLSDFQMTLVADGRSLLADNQLAVEVDEVAAWLEYWNKMRETGATVPPDMQAQFTGTEWPNSPLVRGRAVFANMATQDLAGGYQALTTDTLGMITPPTPVGASNPGFFPRPTSSLTLNARSNFQEQAAHLMDWFVSDPESASILGLVSGPPASRPALEAVLALEDISEVDQKVLRYSQAALARANPAPQAHRADRSLNDLMRRVNENVGFGAYGVQAAAEEFINQGNALLRRS